MKKILLPLFAAAMLFAACENEQDVALELNQQKGVTFTVPDFQNADGTRMAVDVDATGATFTWTAGDTIGVFPANGYQTAFPISGGEGTNTAVFDGADWALRPSAQYAAYYPFKPGMDFGKENISVSYLGQTQDGNGSTAHIGDYDFLASVFNTVSANGNVNFILNHLGCLVRFQLTMPEADTYTRMTVSCDGVEGITVGKFDLTAKTPALTAVSTSSEITLGLQNIQTTAPNQVLTLYMMLPPMNLIDKQIKIKVSGEKVYETTVTGVNMLAGSIYGCTGLIAAPHEYVDLGLPSGLMWATCNVGATQPEEYGDYFAWGEIEPYYTEGHSQDNPCSNWKNDKSSGYNWSSYQWSNNAWELSINKYSISSDYDIVDYKTVLEASDDAAAANWGGLWRMPTTEEQQELLEKCIWTWSTKNSVEGYNVVGPNGNSIFLPAAGFRFNSGLNNVGSDGSYWSSSLDPNLSHYACSLDFRSDDLGCHPSQRNCGFAVRPVCPNPNFIRIASIKITGEKTEIVPSETLQLSAAITPSDATNTSIVWSSSDESIATVSADGLVTAVSAGSVTITATANDGSGVKGVFTITVVAPTHEYVDLGLTSHGKPIYWATCNVGASKPEEYGDYFAWGEIEPYYTEGHAQDSPCSNWKSGKSGYKWLNYKWCKRSYTTLTKYCTSTECGTVDNKTVLETADDAATANWGDSWRMPTRDELSELRSKCTWIWTTKNGVYGYNVYGPNGNTIFLPAAGYRDDLWLYNAGSQGHYWTSSLYSTPRETYNALQLYFYSSSPSNNSGNRCYGFSVRPVCQ